MKNFSTSLICAGFALAAAGALAQDATKKNDMPMAKDGMMKDMTLQECKDHMAMAKKEGASMKKDDAMMKQETKCMDMMKKDGMPAEPMKK